MAVVALAPGLGFAQPELDPTPSLFKIKNYGGKCLDYGQPTHHSAPTVYLNDCALAKPISVEEIHNGRYEVILHAGTKVLGITRPQVNTLGSGLAPTEFALELQDPAGSTEGALGVDQVFALDGDSIILASSRPCVNTDQGGMLVAGWIQVPGDPTPLCPPPPPQLVIQMHYPRGANAPPLGLLVVGPRNLDDSEFWDFEPIDPFHRRPIYPTNGFVRVATALELWNAVCAVPKARLSPDALVPIVDHPGYPDDGMEIRGAGPCSKFNVAWGSVIVVTSPVAIPTDCNHVAGPALGQVQDIGACINLSLYPPIFLPAGVTVRGDRRGTNLGPQLYFADLGGRATGPRCGSCVLEVRGDYVRLTGLRLRGETRSTDEHAPATTAIVVGWPGPESGPLFSITTSTQYIATIDHNDISDWGDYAVAAKGPYEWTDGTRQTCKVMFQDNPFMQKCSCNVQVPGTVPPRIVPIENDPPTLANVRIARNFLHHNERDSGGYGVGVGRAFIEGNTFVSNRHAITAGGEPHDEYRAAYNLVLSSAPQYGSSLHRYFNQDFDMHGTNNPSHWFGGQSGYYVNIFGNTFLGTNRENYELRGVPCHDTDFHDNRSVETKEDAVRYKDTRVPLTWDGSHINISETPNQFELPDPTINNPPVDQLGVGDFDGDGKDDLFLATGQAWYYSSAGRTEWRFLSAKRETVNNLLFGDFDGDGRTDVFTQMLDPQTGRYNWMVSWAGISPWEKINDSQWHMRDFYIGDFVGDRRADVFFARGDQWFVSDAGVGPFVPYATAREKVSELLFGDFDGDGKIDVVGIEGNRYKVVYAKPDAQGNRFWAPLPLCGNRDAPLYNLYPTLIIADFDGNGISDVVYTHAGWFVCYDGVGVAKSLSVDLPLLPTDVAAVGNFDENPGADILFWGSRSARGNGISIVSSGTDAAQPHSRQDMR